MKIKFGAIVTDGRGKIGGHVASKNRSGAYLRTKITPSNPQTSAQSTARSILSSASQNWRNLTDPQRLSWNNAVSDWSKSDIFGDIKNPTGLNLYVKLSANFANIGEVAPLTPPPVGTSPTAGVLSAVLSVATGVLTINFSDDSADAMMAYVRATPPLSAGISFVKSELRVIGYRGVATDRVVLTGDYAAKFGTFTAGDNIHVSVQFIGLNGAKSIEQKIKASVVA